MKVWQRRLIGTFMLGGSFTGIAVISQTALASELDAATTVIAAVFLLLYAYGLVVGLRVLEDQKAAYPLALPFWILQIPVLASPWLTFAMFAGMKVDLTIGPAWKLGFNVQWGAQFGFSALSGSPLVVGVNVFAVWVARLVWKESRRDPEISDNTEGDGDSD